MTFTLGSVIVKGGENLQHRTQSSKAAIRRGPLPSDCGETRVYAR